MPSIAVRGGLFTSEKPSLIGELACNSPDIPEILTLAPPRAEMKNRQAQGNPDFLTRLRAWHNFNTR